MGESGRLSGPVAGRPEIIMAGFGLGQVGYALEGFFLAGTATSFEFTGPRKPTGTGGPRRRPGRRCPSIITSPPGAGGRHGSSRATTPDVRSR